MYSAFMAASLLTAQELSDLLVLSRHMHDQPCHKPAAKFLDELLSKALVCSPLGISLDASAEPGMDFFVAFQLRIADFCLEAFLVIEVDDHIVLHESHCLL